MPIKNKRAVARKRQHSEAIRTELWPDLNEQLVWNRKTHVGFTSLPRAYPLVATIMDALSGRGKPVSPTFLEMWCRTDDLGFLFLSKQQDMAFASGFSGQRAVFTWRERVRRLEALRFISTKPGPSGDLSYAQIYNPYLIVKSHRESGTPDFPEGRYFALVERMQEIGARDYSDLD